MRRTILVIFTIFVMMILSGCKEKPISYDSSFKKTENQYGVEFYNFNENAPPVAVTSSNEIASFKDVNHVMRTINAGQLTHGAQYRKSGKYLFSWDGYQGDKQLTIDLRECDHPRKSQQTYTCVNRIIIKPSKRDKMVNQARSSSTRKFISKDTYEGDWPFTVDFGMLACRRGSVVVFRTVDREVYALNGLAEAQGHSELRPIWKDNPNIPGLKISIGELISDGLKLCD